MKWLMLMVIICSSLFSDIIAVASDGDSFSSNISSKASRCNYYILIDENGKSLEVLQNPHKDVMRGASSKLIDMIQNKKVSHLIASSFGDKLTASLNSHNIKYTIYKGEINTFIENVIKK